MMLLLLALAITVAAPPAETCRATVFAHHGDVYAGGPSRALGRHVQPDDHGYAHRTLPDNTMALICHRGRCALTRKIDSGPYGADTATGWAIKRTARDPGRWRGCVDLTPRTARALGARTARSWSGRVTILAIPSVQMSIAQVSDMVSRYRANGRKDR